jgi:hypothetical protein
MAGFSVDTCPTAEPEGGPVRHLRAGMGARDLPQRAPSRSPTSSRAGEVGGGGRRGVEPHTGRQGMPKGPQPQAPGPGHRRVAQGQAQLGKPTYTCLSEVCCYGSYLYLYV